MTAPHPPDEAARLDAVRRYDILDTPPDGAFDRITTLAARFCRVPISTVTVVDEDRIWFKSSHGVDVDQVGRDPGLCASAILSSDAHVVRDASVDTRTLDNPLVRGELGLRFYAGIPLVTADGYGLGTLNVIDAEPRDITDEELDTLQHLAGIVMDELELRLSARRTIELEAAAEDARFRLSVLAGISHEMRTPLSVLHGLTELDAGGRDDAFMQMQRRNLQQLDWLLNQYLDFVSIEAGIVPNVAPAATDPGQLARRVAAALETEQERIEVVVDDAVGHVLADRERSFQILRELVTNALRFSPPGSPVRIHVRARGDDEVDIGVHDEGPGIPAPDQGRVFDQLYHSSDSMGSGIGLYVARTLAEAQDGRIEVDSTPGSGTRMALLLPAATDAP